MVILENSPSPCSCMKENAHQAVTGKKKIFFDFSKEHPLLHFSSDFKDYLFCSDVSLSFIFSTMEKQNCIL